MSETLLPAAMATMRRVIAAAARKDFVGKTLAEVPTPFLVVDLDVLEKNMTSMQAFCNTNGLLLRPHAKMHKCRAFGAMQLRHGAVGMCVQKVSEAEQLSGMFDDPESCASDTSAAVRNLFISNEIIGAAKLQRLAKLASFLHQGMTPSTSHNKCERYLAVAVDSVEGVQRLAEPLRREGTFVHVLIEVNVGQNRGGCPPTREALTPLCSAIQNNSDVLVFGGLHAYHGGAQHIRSVEERAATIAQSVQHAQDAKAIVEALGMPTGIVTGAGTGTFFLHGANELYGELQPGSYLVMDRDYGENATRHHNTTATPPPTFDHALFLQCTVGSCITDDVGTRLVLDGGHKSAAIDCGGPAVAPFCLRGDLGSAVGFNAALLPYVVADNGGDDHCILRSSSLNVVPRGGNAVTAAVTSHAKDVLLQRYGRVGETLWLVPGHCDPTFNLHDYVVCVRGLTVSHLPRDVVVEDVVAVDCRGCQQ